MENWEKFMLESNKIEGEDRLNPNDKLAFDFAMTGIDSEEEVLVLHEILPSHLNVSWSGTYRIVNVRVGGFRPPTAQNVSILMKDFCEQLRLMNAWTAHNEFEKIHPFQDFNGRTGRLIWLSKAIRREYNFEIPFLQEYYYQTLEHQQNKEEAWVRNKRK